MPVTLCLMPSPGEAREIVKYVLAEAETVVALPARHMIDRVEVDPQDDSAVAVWVDGATDRARPVDVRFELRAPGDRPGLRSRLVGPAVWQGAEVEVYGTYLGPVSDEN